MLHVGLTGGIACGKSYVLRRLGELGCIVIDLDRLAHGLIQPGTPAHAEILEAFGHAVRLADGTIDRKSMATQVFADAESRRRLNAILHPRVRALALEQAERHRARPGAIVVSDGALLVEAGMHLDFDRLLVVHCDRGEQRRRLMTRDHLDEDAAQARLDAQMAIEEKRRFAHLEIDTTGSFNRVDQQIDSVHSQFRLEAQTAPEKVKIALRRVIGCLAFGPEEGPRSLSPVQVFADIVACGRVELEKLTSIAEPAAVGAWYEAAHAGGERPSPATLMGAVVLGTLSWRDEDEKRLLANAFSVARLTHHDSQPLVEACAFALLLRAVAQTGSVPPDVVRFVASRRTALEGAAENGDLSRVVAIAAAARDHTGDAASARRALADPEAGALAGALVGLLRGATVEEAPAAVREVFGRIGESSAFA